MEFSDHELVREIRAGSEVAFERLMGRYERLVFKIAYGVTANRDGALDITQEVFLKVHSRLPDVPQEGQLKPWIARVAMNESINWSRARRRRPTTELDGHPVDLSAGPSQEDGIRQAERRELLAASLRGLNKAQRSALVLRYFEEMSIHEIATVLERSEGVVKNLLFRGLRKLRARLETSAEVTS